jgi:hypothetical protein
LEDAHVTEDERSAVDPSLKFPVAVNCSVALTAMLGFEGAMEIEFSDFVVFVIVAGDPQPAIDIKAIGRAREESFTKLRSKFILTL